MSRYRQVFSEYGIYMTRCEDNLCRDIGAQDCGYMRGDYGSFDIAVDPDLKCNCKCHNEPTDIRRPLQ